MNYKQIREEYPTFIYDRYEINEDKEKLKATFYFEIAGLKKFTPSIEFNKKDFRNISINDEFIKDLVFHIGLVELVSYWKCTLSKNVIINAGYLDTDQINWFKKLYYHGLGEFFYVNNIDTDLEDLMDITIQGTKLDYQVQYEGKGNLIAIGGGKDSIVSMNLLKNMYEDNDTCVMNPKSVHLDCIKVGGYKDKNIVIKRNLDKGLLELNDLGYLNGHTPFSSLVSFVTLLTAYITNKKYIVLSNESSANESNVEGTKINHQYSKSYEYECDFNNYVNKYFGVDIHYFSLLRPLAEIQIAKLFTKYKEYHKVFKSCNKGSKSEKWHWCCDCPKCLFVYIILSPFLSDEEMINIFGENLYTKESLLDIFIELTGNSVHKPFECVGTYEEVNLAITKKIDSSSGKLPHLLEYYKNHYYNEVDDSLLANYNEENNVPEEFIDIIKGAIYE